jgi:hypothetical protein
LQRLARTSSERISSRSGEFAVGVPAPTNRRDTGAPGPWARPGSRVAIASNSSAPAPTWRPSSCTG